MIKSSPSVSIHWKIISASGLMTFLLLLFLIFINHYAPFGTNSFTQVDASIQYLDFFSYLKGLLQGNNSWTFSFDRGIGGNIWVVLTYYLFSPWNLLVLFFQQENFHSFYDILVLIKLSLSAMTMTVYLEYRFKDKLSSSILLALGISFGLMQYNLEQARNVMWLDGVYLLPLILLGIYQFKQNKSILYFVIPSALAIFFNWYTGLIDLLFAGFWSIWEAAIWKAVTKKKRFSFVVKISLAIFLAVGLSSVAFLPTLMELSNGRTSSFDWGLLHAIWKGSTSAVFTGMTWGTFSSNGHVSLFSGSLVLLGVIGFFFQNGIGKKLRILSLIMLVFMVAIFYWQPFFLLFSLLKDASSYWYRYSYLSIFFLIWLAGYFFSFQKYELPDLKLLLFVPFIWLILQSHHGYNGWGNIFGTSVIFMCLAALFYYHDTHLHRYGNILLMILVLLDLGFNANYILRHQDGFKDVQHYHDYVIAEKQQIAYVVPLTNELYRITQTKTYLYDEKKHTTANYNEGMAYHYPTIASYTSSPVNAHLNFLDKLGYRRNGDNMNIVNTSLLGADALFGVRYVLADYPIAGLIANKDKVATNDKDVYDNLYAMPIAFCISDNTAMHHNYENDPFQFTNELYADIFQQSMDVYQPLPYKLLNFDGRKQAEFQVSSNRNGAVYGNFPFQNKDRNAFLTLNDDTRQFYAGWCAPSVFYLPMSNGMGNVKWQSEKDAADVIEHAQFYQVDEKTLAAATEKAWEKAAQVERDSDTHLRIHVDAENGEKLFTSIPVHKGWQVICNGEKVKPEAFEDCLMVIPLEDGHNEITLNFELPGWKKGLCISLASVIVCFMILCHARLRKYTK